VSNNLIVIDFDLLNEISEYAKAHVESSKKHYADRNQSHNYIFHQVLNGKIAEFSLYYYLKEKNYKLAPPDLKHYAENKKSHSADLVVNNKTHLHVKSITQDSLEKYGISFLVEKNDPETINPSDDNFYVIMKQVSFLVYEPHSFVASKSISWKAPINRKLVTKLAYYES
jgi:hypothetical protein